MPACPIKFKILLCLVIVSTYVTAQNQYSYTSPKPIADGWPTASVTDASRIEALFNQLAAAEHKLDSTVLIKDGHIVLERYFGGYHRDQPHDLRSVTKSIRALLVGIAIDQGYIDDANDSIFKYLKSHQIKKNKHPLKQQITIKHLLTMSTGLECNDWDKKSKGQEDRVYKKKDWIQYTLDLPLSNDPGEAAFYCSMGSMLAAEVVAQASGMPTDVFAAKYLFKPLNITTLSWGHTSKRKHILPSGKRLYLTSRDLAKIGQLVLQQGQWQGQQIVAKEWVELATTPQIKLANLDYGYFWWLIPFQVNEQVYQVKTATGNGGQYIFVLPELNMVAVFTGSAYNSAEDKLPFAIIKDIYLPTLLAES